MPIYIQVAVTLLVLLKQILLMFNNNNTNEMEITTEPQSLPFTAGTLSDRIQARLSNFPASANVTQGKTPPLGWSGWLLIITLILVVILVIYFIIRGNKQRARQRRV